MTPPDDETLWRNRFITLNLARIGATLVVLLGLAIWHSSLIVEGGSMLLGLPITLIALAASFLLPQYLARKWRTPPRQ